VAPLLTVASAVAFPNWLRLFKRSVPSWIKTFPEFVLSRDSVSVPVPVLMKLPDPDK
jgi:hypothetical protein